MLETIEFLRLWINAVDKNGSVVVVNDKSHCVCIAHRPIEGVARIVVRTARKCSINRWGNLKNCCYCYGELCISLFCAVNWLLRFFRFSFFAHLPLRPRFDVVLSGKIANMRNVVNTLLNFSTFYFRLYAELMVLLMHINPNTYCICVVWFCDDSIRNRVDLLTQLIKWVISRQNRTTKHIRKINWGDNTCHPGCKF